MNFEFRPGHVEWRRFLDKLQDVAPFTLDGLVPGEMGWFDESQLEQVMINLLKNAAEAGSPPSSTVVADTRVRGIDMLIASVTGSRIGRVRATHTMPSVFSSRSTA